MVLRLSFIALLALAPAGAAVAESSPPARAASALADIAAFLIDAQEIDAAIAHLEHAAGLAARAVDIPPRTVARRMAALADLKARRGEDEASRRLYETAIAMLDHGPPQAPLRLIALGNLAALHLEHGRERRAEQVYQRALSIAEVRGEDPALAPLLIGLGEAQRRLGRTQSAERSVRRAIALLRAVDDTASPHAAAGYGALGRLYADAGRWSEAAAHFSDALGASERSVGMLAADSIGYAFELAHAQAALDQVRTADALYLRAIRALAQGPGTGHPAARRHAEAYDAFLVAHADRLEDSDKRRLAVAGLFEARPDAAVVPASRRIPVPRPALPDPGQ